MSKHKGLYVALGLAGALVVLLGAVDVAYAQGPQPPVGHHPFYCSDDCVHAGRTSGGWGWGRRGFSLVDAAAEATGLTEDEVIAALQEGQTFAQIAEAQGVDSQALVDAFLADREAALEQAVADGWLTQEQADWMLAEMTEHVSERVTQPWTPHSSGAGRMGHGGFGRRSRMESGFAPRFSPQQ